MAQWLPVKRAQGLAGGLRGSALEIDVAAGDVAAGDVAVGDVEVDPEAGVATLALPRLAAVISDTWAGLVSCTCGVASCS